MKTVRCFHQVFRPPPETGKALMDHGFGDCTVCKLDPEENKKCRGYQPTTIKSITFFVKKKKILEAVEAEVI